MKSQGVGTLGKLDQNRIIRSFVRIVLRQLYSQAPGLNPDGGIALWIESGRTAQNFGGNLVLLEGEAGMIEGVLGQVTK